jgi:hypothetical protein
MELNFQLPPGAKGRLGTSGLVTGDELGFSWIGSQPLTATVREGGMTPDQGWVAPSVGVRCPAPRLTLTSTLRRQHEAVLTIVADRAGMRVAEVRPLMGKEYGLPLAIEVTAGDFIDRIVATGGRSVTVANVFETDASLAIWRFKHGGVMETERLGGTFMRLSGQQASLTEMPCVAPLT